MSVVKRCQTFLLGTAVTALSGATQASADVGLLRLQESAGPFSISVFTEPTPLRKNEGIVHVFVSDRQTGQPLQDVAVEALLRSDDAQGGELIRPLQRRPRGLRASADLAVPHPGRWNVRIAASGNRGTGAVGLVLDVLPAQPWWISLGPALAIPPVGIALFALHRRLRRRQESGRRTGAVPRESGVSR